MKHSFGDQRTVKQKHVSSSKTCNMQDVGSERSILLFIDMKYFIQAKKLFDTLLYLPSVTVYIIILVN